MCEVAPCLNLSFSDRKFWFSVLVNEQFPLLIHLYIFFQWHVQYSAFQFWSVLIVSYISVVYVKFTVLLYFTEKNTTKTRSIFALPEHNLCSTWEGGGEAPSHSARKDKAWRKSVAAEGRGGTDSGAALQVRTHHCLSCSPQAVLLLYWMDGYKIFITCIGMLCISCLQEWLYSVAFILLLT